MKLLFCGDCSDVFRLTKEERICQCGKTKGKYYEDGLHAEYSGEKAYPLGFANGSFVTALKDQPQQGRGKRFEAFVIAKDCDTFYKKA